MDTDGESLDETDVSCPFDLRASEETPAFATRFKRWIQLPHQASVEKWNAIESLLRATRIRDVSDLVELIQALVPEWEIPVDLEWLLQYFGEHLSQDRACHILQVTIGKIIESALLLPVLFQTRIPELLQDINMTLLFSPAQLHCLLSHAFLGTLTPHYIDRSRDLPDMHFYRLFCEHPPRNAGDDRDVLFSQQCAKLDCLFHYFDTALSITDGTDRVVAFKRKSVPFKALPDFTQLEVKPLAAVTVRIDGSIEDTPEQHALHVDFANRSIGGGVLSRVTFPYCLQEHLILHGITSFPEPIKKPP